MNKLLIIIFSVLLVIISYNGDDQLFSLRVYLSSIVIQIFSVICIFSDSERSFSLHKMFYLFNLFFLGVAPIQQFYKSAAFFGSRQLYEYEYFYLNLIIIAILIFYQCFYYYFLKLKLTDRNIQFVETLKVNFKLSIKQIFLLFSISIISFLTIFYLNKFNIVSMLIRGGELKEQSENIESSTMLLIIGQTIRPLSFMCLLYFSFTRSKNIIAYFGIFLLALVTCSPAGMPRSLAAAIYIPLLLTLLPFVRRKNVFSLIFVSGFLVVFPLLNSFRYFSEDEGSGIGIDTGMFVSGHFDNYQNFALILFENIITWGQQLLGVFLFWVPRSVWPDKPIGSGALLAELQHFSLKNVSANFFAEGYINFGFFGIFLFIIILAFFNAKMDNMYWRSARFNKRSFFTIIYYTMLGLEFFIMRGDLLSCFAYTIGIMISIFTVFKIVNRTQVNSVG